MSESSHLDCSLRENRRTLNNMNSNDLMRTIKAAPLDFIKCALLAGILIILTLIWWNGVNVKNTPNVNVANTILNPVSVNVENEPDVDVANTPDVNVDNSVEVDWILHPVEVYGR